jgi:hypothetical protein
MYAVIASISPLPEGYGDVPQAPQPGSCLATAKPAQGEAGRAPSVEDTPDEVPF